MRRYVRKVGLAGAGLAALALLTVALAPFDASMLYPEEAYRYFARGGEPAAIIISDDGYFRMHTPTSQIAPAFVETVLQQEDRYFYYHPGINPFSAARALFDNISQGRVVSGASTLTMQLARMLERKPRTIRNKLKEAFLALQIEWNLSKDEILALYLLRAPYGGNIEGVEAAAWLYFNKPASQLSFGEVALLVNIPRAPNTLRPDRFPKAARLGRDRVLADMLRQGLVSEDAYRGALVEPVLVTRKVPDNIIPHLSYHLRQKYPKAYGLRTTIDYSVQRRVTTLLRLHLDSMGAFQIENAAAVVIDNDTRGVLAWVGSGDYFSKASSGAVDGVRAARSPGSTLKPFIYGLALQRGLVTPKSILFDIPQNYGGYQPQNYSKNFRGIVRTQEALTESLNVVAVRLSNRLGHTTLYDFLQSGGINTLDQPSSYYGLPLVLGGAELRPLELTNLYVTLANMGMHAPPRLLLNEPQAPAKRILHEGASWLVAEMLTDVERPDFPESWQFSKTRSKIAWKTGTSYGHQDAWSIGFTKARTVGIWVGNFDGSPSLGLVGRETAAPLLFDVHQAISQGDPRAWFERPSSVGVREVCEVCGTLPGAHCPGLINDYFIVDIEGPVTTEICDIPQQIAVDTRTDEQADADTPEVFVERRTFNIWPSEVATFLRGTGVPVDRVPSYDIRSMTGQRYYPPKILNPQPGTAYYRRLDRFGSEHHGIKLSGAATNRVRDLVWLLNGRLIGRGPPGQEFVVNPPPGDHRVTLVDDVGGSAEVTLVVRDFRAAASGAR